MTAYDKLLSTLPPAPDDFGDDPSYCSACIALAWGALGLPRLSPPEWDRPADYSDDDTVTAFDACIDQRDNFDLADLLQNRRWTALMALSIAAQWYANAVLDEVEDGSDEEDAPTNNRMTIELYRVREDGGDR